MERLAEIFVFEIRVFGESLRPVRIKGGDLQNTTDSVPSTAKARLAVHDERVDRNPVN